MNAPPIIAPAENLQAEESIVGSHAWLVVPMAFILGALLVLAIPRP